jgi:hypothetical protein
MQAGRFLLILVLAISMGGHLTFLQTIAWGGMLLSYAGKASFSEAVTKTFDGEHPCELCALVRQSKQDHEKRQEVQTWKKQDVILASTACAPQPRYEVVASPSFPYLRSSHLVWPDRFLRPPREV